MSPDSPRTAHVREWFLKAANDLRAAQIDLTAEPPLHEDALFHAQQAVEKALKGFLTWHEQSFRKVHDLRELGEQCVALDSALEPLLRQAAPLTRHAVAYRYPFGSASGLEEAHSALTLAREVVEAILTRLPAEVRP